jgi:hypothetical protein
MDEMDTNFFVLKIPSIMWRLKELPLWHFNGWKWRCSRWIRTTNSGTCFKEGSFAILNEINIFPSGPIGS